MVEDGRVSPKKHLMDRAAANDARCDAVYQQALADSERHRLGPETPGQTFGRLVKSMVGHALDFEASKQNEASPRHLRAKEGLAADRDEFRSTFLRGDDFDGLRERTFAEVVDIRVEAAKRRAEERAEDAEYVQDIGRLLAQRREAMKGDWPAIRTEFPGQYEEPDYERQALVGDPPVVDIVNFGNHMPRKGIDS